jgi:endo-1,3-1,4-beta-glycanase ExoK
MTRARSFRFLLLLPWSSWVALPGCNGSGGPPSTGGVGGTGGAVASIGGAAGGGAAVSGGEPGTGAAESLGGTASSTGGTSGPASGGTGSADAGVGGTSVTGGGPASGGSGSVLPDGPFVLLFRDDFDELDTARWELMTHSWAGNIALFSSESVKVESGELSITLLDAPDGTTDGTADKAFLGAEVRSRDTLTYGRVRMRAKLAAGSAVVSSLVTIYTPWPADNWNELDIELLGKDPTEVQFNAMVYTGVLPAPSTPVSPTQDPTLYALGFDSSLDYHEYTIEWTPEEARYLVDGKLAHTWTKAIDLMTLPQNVLLTIWASDAASWAGPVDATTTGAKAVYDWIELYQYSP